MALDVTTITVTRPSDALILPVLNSEHSFYLVEYPTTGDAAFTAANNYADFFTNDLPLTPTIESTEVERLSGAKLRSARRVTFDNAEAQVQTFVGQTLFNLLKRYSASRTTSTGSGPKKGARLAFVRGYPDDFYFAGAVTVERMWAVSDTSAEEFLHNVEFAFSDVYEGPAVAEPAPAA